MMVDVMKGRTAWADASGRVLLWPPCAKRADGYSTPSLRQTTGATVVESHTFESLEQLYSVNVCPNLVKFSYPSESPEASRAILAVRTSG